MRYTQWIEILFLGFIMLLTACSKDPIPVVNPIDSFLHPYSSSSIWNRPVSANAEFVDVQNAIWGDTAQAPTSVYPDLVGIYYVNQSQPLTNFRLTQGWNYPERSNPKGETLFQRKLSPDAGTDLRYPNNGNANYVIIDPATGLADEGTGSWRDSGSDFLTFYDGNNLHNLDVINGDGLLGSRGSRLPSLGGAIRLGELGTLQKEGSGINHAMAVMLSSRRYSKDVHYIWPAHTGDGFASNPIYGYLGDNPYYTIGTLLTIPYNIDIDSINWRTPQGVSVAKAAQEYGLYIVDSGTGESGGNTIAIGIERQAAYNDMGLTINTANNEQEVDPTKIDMLSFNTDVQQILRLVAAVKNNN